MGCFNDNKLQSVDPEEGKIAPRPSEVLIYQQSENEAQYHILHTDGDNCVYGLMKTAGDLNNAGGVEADFTTSLDVEVSINPSADYGDLDNLANTFIDPTCKPTRPPNAPPWVVIPCQEISTVVNVGIIKARYVDVHDSDMSSTIIDNGLTRIFRSRLTSTTIDSKLLIFIKSSKIQEGSTMNCQHAVIVASDVDTSINATCLLFILAGSTIKGDIETPELILFDAVLNSDVVVNAFQCYLTTVNGNINIETTNNQSDCINIRSVGPAAAGSRRYYNYECVSSIFYDTNGRGSCIKNTSGSPGPLILYAAEVISYLDQYNTAIQNFYASISFSPQQNYKIILIKTVFNGNFTSSSDENILAIDVAFAGGSIDVRNIVSPNRNSAASNFYDVRLIDRAQFKCLSVDNISIGADCAAEIFNATAIRNFGRLQYSNDSLNNFVQDGFNAETNFTSSTVSLGQSTGGVRINGGTITFNSIVFSNGFFTIANCTIEGNKIFSEGLRFSGCTVKIEQYEQASNRTRLILENATVLDAKSIDAPIIVNAGCVLNMASDYNNNFIRNFGIINGSNINTIIYNHTGATIEADTITCLPASLLENDSSLVSGSVNIDNNTISCNIDADLILIYNDSRVSSDANFTGGSVMLYNTRFRGNAAEAKEINFYASFLDGGTVSNAFFDKDSVISAGYISNGNIEGAEIAGLTSVEIDGNIIINESNIDNISILFNTAKEGYIAMSGSKAVNALFQYAVPLINILNSILAIEDSNLIGSSFFVGQLDINKSSVYQCTIASRTSTITNSSVFDSVIENTSFTNCTITEYDNINFDTCSFDNCTFVPPL